LNFCSHSCHFCFANLNAPNLQVCDITAKWNALWSDPLLRGQAHAFYYEVIGSGAIYMARIQIDYLP
jgi:hypothetical protein